MLESIVTKSKKRVGRGISAGQGKTAGRGTKGQKARAGHNIPNRFEGGQTPLGMRLPKLPGFKSTRKRATVITLDAISNNFADGDTVNYQTLVDKGLIRPGERAKILNTGKLTKKVQIAEDISTSGSVRELVAAVEAERKPEKAAKPKKTDQTE